MKASRSITLVACLLVAGSGAARVAAVPVKPAPITVAITQLGCSTALGAGTFEARSWSWGATSTFASGGVGGGEAAPEALILTRVSDACSPALLAGVLIGKSFPTFTLSQYDTAGVLKATVVLENAILSEWHIGGTNTSAEPTEQLTVSFLKFNFMDVASSNKVCYDVAQNKAC